MRFAEVRATCATPIKNDFRPMDSQRCWASSRLDRLWRFDWMYLLMGELIRNHNEGRDFAGYPCKDYI